MPARVPSEAAYSADSARNDLGVGLESPLADILSLVEQTAGVPVVVAAFHENIAGLFRRRREGAFIFINGTQPLVRQRFTLAHEFGHYWLGHKSVLDRPSDLFTFSNRDPREVEANQFAGEFLAPRRAVTNWIERHAPGSIGIDDVVRLAWTFGISAKSASIRMQDSGYLSRREANLIDREIEEGQHFKRARALGLTFFQDSLSEIARLAESGDAPLPRAPQQMQRDARLAYQHGLLDIDQIATRLHQDRQTVSAAFSDLAQFEDSSEF